MRTVREQRRETEDLPTGTKGGSYGGYYHVWVCTSRERGEGGVNDVRTVREQRRETEDLPTGTKGGSYGGYYHVFP